MENGEREEGEGGAPAVDRRDEAGGGSSAAAPVMRWESFLPRRSLRVLLVEGDDSTRHIVTALLRKCNYRVAGVADGMKAWEVMKEKWYCFDLVLTEVATPSLSGIGLLTKIMGAEECKNIPVIMMSTHDSVNVVLKCMLTGAVDFLVKPVRKNELRNLWQHVWRRHCSNSWDNNTASNQISANVGGRCQTGENSDERTDAQSSGSKRDIEIESIQKHEEPPQVEDRRTGGGEVNLDSSDKDATFRTSVSQMDNGGNTRDGHHNLGNKTLTSFCLADNPVGIRVDVTLPIQEASAANVSQERNQSCNISSYGEETMDLVRSAEGNNDDPKSYCQNNPPNDSVQNMIIFVEPISNGQSSYAVLKKDARVKYGSCEAAKSSYVNETLNIGTSSLWEPSLRRTQPNCCVQPDLKEKHVLKHSVASAFSRYGEKRIHSSFKTVSSDVCVRIGECVENCNSLVNSHGTDNEKNTPFSHTKKSLASPRGNEGGTTVYFQVASTSKENVVLPSPPTENDCAGHSSAVEDTALPCPQLGFMPLPIPVGAIPYQSLCAGYGGILQPVFYPETRIPSSDHSAHHNNHLISNSSPLDFHHHDITDHPRHWRQAIDISEPGDCREFCNQMEQAYQSGNCSQDVLKGSGSNVNGETPEGARNTNALESGNESGVQNCNRKALDSDCSRREAALIKFRMKRKDRCFEKKVRYYSRKKLAEQRPRIKGQFVRQKVPESMSTAGDS